METSLSLDEFRRILGYNPWHWWGFSDDDKLKVTSSCNDILYKYAWQAADQAGRDDVIEAIQSAESRLAEYLGYHVAPVYRDEIVQWPQFYNSGMDRHVNLSSSWKRIGVKLPRGFIQKVGYQRLTAIDDTVTVVLTDEDGDGVDETFTLTVATSVTDPDEIAIYFTAADRWDGSSAGEQWRVRPVSVSISGGVATIVGRAWLIAKPVQYEQLRVQGLDPATAGVLAAELGVYRLWYDPDGIVAEESQGVLIWDTKSCHGWWCCCDSCSTASTTPADSRRDPAAEARAVARVGIKDPRLGIVAPAEAIRNATTGIWSEQGYSDCPEPDRVRVRYLSGKPLVSHQMDPFWQRIVARMAAAELGRRICACDQANRELYTWQFDLSRARGANDEQFAAALSDMGNPFGTRRGHVYAWKETNRMKLGEGIAI